MIANNFDELEKYALRTSKIGTKEQLIRLRHGSNSGSSDSTEKDGSSSQKLKHYDDIMRKEIRAHDSVYRNDPRARRYLGSKGSQEAAAQRDKEAMGRINFWDGAKPEGWGAGVGRNMWSDFGAGGDEATENVESEDNSPNQQTKPDRRPENQQDSGTDEESPDTGPDDTGEPGSTTKDPEAEGGVTPEAAPEAEAPVSSGGPGLSGSDTGGANAAQKVGGGATEAAGGAGKAAGLVSEAAPLAGAAAPVGAAGSIAPVVAGASSGAPVVGAAAGLALTPQGVMAIIGIVAILLVGFSVFFFWNPEEAKGDESGAKTSIICLDAGHPPNGAGGEPATNLKVAKEVQTELTSRGYTVIMTRTNNNDVAISDRAEICAKGGARFMYSFHADGTPRSAGYPYQIYMSSNRKLAPESKDYATRIQAAVFASVKGSAGLKDGGTCAEGSCTAVDQLGIFSGADTAGIPAVLTEMVQMNGGTSVLENDSTRKKLVVGIADGISGIFPANNSSGGSAGGAKAAEYALAQLGDNYSQAARCGDFKNRPAPDGCDSYDCSGLVVWAWYWGSDKKVTLPGTTSAMWGKRDDKTLWTKVADFSDLQAGDLILWNGHVTIAMSNQSVVSASSPSTGVVKRDLKGTYLSYVKEHNYVLLRPVIK